MKYGISKLILGYSGFVELSEKEFQLAKNAREGLFEALFLEEKLDLVTENFCEYEAELSLLATQNMIFMDDDYFLMSRQRNLVSRRIINLLTSCRMYIDQMPQHIERMLGTSSETLNIGRIREVIQYEKSLSYRVMEALRNYVQHRDFPIHSLVFESVRVGKNENIQLRHQLIPLIKINELAEDKKFKKRILEELKSLQSQDDSLDIRPMIREYVEGIGQIHEAIRLMIHPNIDKWENTVESVICRFKDEFGEDVSLVGLVLVDKDKDGKYRNTFSIFREFIERRRALELKNRIFINLRKRYVSNEVAENAI